SSNPVRRRAEQGERRTRHYGDVEFVRLRRTKCFAHHERGGDLNSRNTARGQIERLAQLMFGSSMKVSGVPLAQPVFSSAVLVVEDDEMLRMCAADVVADAGFTAIEATNADE